MPFIGLGAPEGVAVDSAGDVFVADLSYPGRVLELPKTSTGYGPQTTVSSIDLVDPYGVALDSAGDLFATGNFSSTYSVVVAQIQAPVNFGGAYACMPGDPAQCSQALTLIYNVAASGTLGTPQVLTGGKPKLDFTLGKKSTCIGAVTEGSTCVVNVTFAPEAVGARSGVVEITDSGGTVLTTTALYGSGIEPPPVAQVSAPGKLKFATIPIGDSETLSLTVTNIGGGTLTIAPVITGKSAPPYTITGNSCGAGLTSGKSCILEVQFSPTLVGTYDDVLTLQTNGTANPALDLLGSASAGGLEVSGAPLQFGTIPYGSSAVLPLTITNYGLSGAVTVSATRSGSYSVLTTAQNTCQAGVTAGHSCTLPVQFAPDSVGAHNGILTLSPSSGGSIPISVTGIEAGLEVSAPVLQFGNVAVGFSEVATLTLTNVGLATITVETAVNEHNYTVLTTTQNTCQSTLAEGQSCTLPVEFSPSSLGYHYGILTLTPSAGAPATLVGLKGTAVALTQSVTFAGSPATLVPWNAGLGVPGGIAVDSTANLFIAVPGVDSDYAYGGFQAVELPWTELGYGPQIYLPAFPFTGPVAVDSAGDVFLADPFYYVVVELPRTGMGYGPRAILPFSGLDSPNGIAVDSAGDVFVSDAGNARVAELPRVGTGYGPQTTVPTDGLYGPVAVDGAGDLFILDTTGVVELPRTGTGYGSPATLPFSGLNGPNAIAVDSTGDVFVTNANVLTVVELPRTGTGYGPQTTLLDVGLPTSLTTMVEAIAVDSAGDHLFIANQDAFGYCPCNPEFTYGGNVVEVQTHSVNFGSTYLSSSGKTPYSTTLTLDFAANANLTLGTPLVLTGGAPNLDFTLASGSSCTGAVTEGSFCTVNVTFSPLALGTRNGTVEIVDGSGNIVATVPISGVGTGEPVAEVSTATLQFGQTGFGTSETLPLTVTNIGQGTLIVLPSINAPSYTITGNTCGAGVTAGKSCTLEVGFSPAAIGTDNGLLTLQNNGPSAPAVTLDGIANGLSVATSPLEFGAVAQASPEVLQLTITNVGLPGTVTMAAKSSDPSYTVLTTAQNTCQAGITAGQSCTLPVQFAPDSKGDHAGTLTLTASAEAATTVVGLDGEGVGGVTFTGALTTLPFTGLNSPGGIGVDSTGDVFLYDVGNLRVLELPRTSTGFGPQVTLLASSGLQPFDGSLAGLAVDSAGDVFITDAGSYAQAGDCGEVVEIPWTGTGYGPARGITIYSQAYAYMDGCDAAQPTGIAVDSLGNIITTDNGNDFDFGSVLWMPRGEYGIGIGAFTVGGVAVDSAGDVFGADTGDEGLFEVAKTSTGYGPQTSLPFNGSPYGVAVDNAGNLFVVAGDLVEVPKTPIGYGPQTTALTGSFGTVATDNVGNVYVTQGTSVLELQRNSVNFGSANVCAPGATTPAPCSQTLTLSYSANSSVTFGAPKILTGGKPNLDFTLASGSTCTGTVTEGSSCTLNVTFAPLSVGTRTGTVEIIDSNGGVRATTPISGLGIGPANAPAATPLLSPGSGSYSSVQLVTLSDATPGAVIHYTTDGTTPTASSASYSARPITVSNSQTIQAIAVASGYANSAVAAARYTINLAMTTASLLASINPAAVGETVTFTLTVKPTSGSGIPTGTITFSVDGGARAVVSLDGTGNARYSSHSLGAGSHAIVAFYSGNSSYAPSSASLIEDIGGVAATPTFSPVPGMYSSSQPVTITDSTPGSVIYYTTNGTAPSASSTKYTGGITVASTESIQAIAVASGYSNSAVASAIYIIAPSTTTETTLISSRNPSVLGQGVQFTATVTGGNLPSGTVSFSNGSTVFATTPLIAGVAATVTYALPLGINEITATYSGDGTHAASTSTVVSQSVEITTTTMLTASANPSIPKETVTYTATVAATSGATPTGTVTFYSSATELATVPLSAGTASTSISTLTTGHHTITATYSGNSMDAPSKSSVLVQTVNP